MKTKVMWLVLGFFGLATIAMAQVASGTATLGCTAIWGYNGDHDGDGIPNYKDDDFLKKYKPAWANRPAGAVSEQIGDGTRPRPRDGTGFGAQKNGRGKAYGSSSTSATMGQNVGNGQGRGKGRGKGNGQRKRDGSCQTTTPPEK